MFTLTLIELLPCLTILIKKTDKRVHMLFVKKQCSSCQYCRQIFFIAVAFFVSRLVKKSETTHNYINIPDFRFLK